MTVSSQKTLLLLEIAKLLASSHTTPAVARLLRIEPKTAEAHIRIRYAKLGLDEIDNPALHLNARSIFVKICSLYKLQYTPLEHS